VPDSYGHIALGGLLIILLGGLLVMYLVRRPAFLDAARPPSLADLNRQANERLVEADNALKTAEQFGPAPAAHREMAEAFRLRQQLDEAYPADELVQRELLAQIVGHCAAVERELPAAPAPAADLTTRRDSLRRRLSSAANTLASLQSRYAASAFAAVGDNVEQAAGRVDRATPEALTEAETLLGAIDRLDTDLRAADVRLRALLPKVQTQVEAGKAAEAAAIATVARAEQVAIDVRNDLNRRHPDPIGSLARLEFAAADLDSALGEAADHAPALLDHAVFSARSAVDSANRFIVTRRGAVGCVGRTRLMEAQRHLDEASGLTDPVAALAAARRATGLAEQALNAARADLDHHRQA
jgi:hypothetical protein